MGKAENISPTFIPKYEGIAPSSGEYISIKTHQQNFVRKCDECEKEFDMFPAKETNWCYKIRLSNMKLKVYCCYSCQIKAEKRGVGENNHKWRKGKYGGLDYEY